jgi:hypothetical protein
MIALLLKNGVVVKNNASDQEIAMLMANLLKVSKSYFNDLNKFIMNPSVTQVVVGQINQTAQYLKMSGNGYMNYEGEDDNSIPDILQTPSYDVPNQSDIQTGSDYQDSLMQELDNMNTGDNVLDSAPVGGGSSSGSSTGWFSGIKANLGNYISDGIKLFGQISTNNANTAIANAHAQVATAQVATAQAGGATSGGTKTKTPSKPMSTTTKVFIGLGVVAVLGFGVYFAMKASKK